MVSFPWSLINVHLGTGTVVAVSTFYITAYVNTLVQLLCSARAFPELISLAECRPNIMTCSKLIFTSASNNFPSPLEVLQQSKQVRNAIELCVWIYLKVWSAGPNNRLQGRLISLMTLDFVISIYKFRVHIDKRYIIISSCINKGCIFLIEYQIQLSL